jgi:SAM-dependent methyltransferase
VPLLGSNELVPLLRCPRCHGPLASRNGGLACVSAGCGLAGRVFPQVAGQHALVDFERSVITEAELRARAGASCVPRRSDRGLQGVLRRLSSPPSRVAERHMRDLVARLRAGGGRPRALVVGGGTRNPGSEVLYEDPGLDVIAFDIYASPETRFIGDVHGLPLADSSMQAVSVQAVLEHVVEPWRAVSEIERVLAPGGLVYAVTPFLQHVHEGPWDFTRFTESGHRWLFRNFERLDSGVVAGPATAWVWSTEQLVRGLTRSFIAGKAARFALSWVHLLDRLIPESHAVDGASCLYFYGRRSGVPLEPSDAIREYRGAQRRA